MNNRVCKISITLAVVALCCIVFVHSLKCYTCTSVSDCKKPKLQECNYNLANQTREYLNWYYSGLPNATTYGFECMSDWLKTYSSEMAHRGCIYNNFQSCSYSIRPYYAQSHKRSCKQCYKDKCNPADRTSSNLFAIVFTLCATALAKYL
ncbi:uncharacterized protein [Eurosta solidaginis]|uniref:uncharacterized protein n=1 Tax=Eurosta solidaginis TaxID=178769 RepID=UPI003530C504